MDKGTRIKDINPGDHVEGVFAVRSAVMAKTRSGDPYWNLCLMDASGSIECRIWKPLCAEFSEIPQGGFVLAAGTASSYRDKCQLVIERMRLIAAIGESGLDMAEFMPASPYAITDMFDELRQLAAREFTHAPWLRFFESLFSDEVFCQEFCLSPAATGVHHAYAGGLLEHTLGVARLCMRIAESYGELDRQTLLAGAISHDIGKTRELTRGLRLEYTQAGRLEGHISLGLEMLEPHLRASGLEPWLREHLRHLVLSHHGQLEYGAPRLPQTAEAFALHYADNLDARLAQCRSLFELGCARPAWSQWQSLLGRSILLPEATPAPPDQGSAPSDDADTCADEYFVDDEEWEPDPDELAEIYSDPDFNMPDDAGSRKRRDAGGAHKPRNNNRDHQCSLL